MADRTTSGAKDVQLDSYKDHLLSAYGETSQSFNEQSRDQTPLEKNQEDIKAAGSSMVREDAPTNDNRPPPEIAQTQDRKTFDEKWKAEQEKSSVKDEYSQYLVDRYANNQELNNEKGGHENDWDYSR